MDAVVVDEKSTVPDNPWHDGMLCPYQDVVVDVQVFRGDSNLSKVCSVCSLDATLALWAVCW